MKKAVISIILILPFLLIIIISIAGKIYDNKNFVKANDIYFVNENNEKLNANDKLIVEMGKPYKLNYVISPNNSTNQTPTFYSADPTIISVDNKGVITPHISNALVRITMELENLKAFIDVEAVEYSINFEFNSTTIAENETIILNLVIKPNNFNPKIEWSLSNEDFIKINSCNNYSAQIIGIKKGTTTITAKSTDGKYSAKCDIIVSGNLKVRFIKENNETSREITTRELDLLSTVTFGSEINSADIVFEIEKSSPSSYITIENNRVLKFNEINSGYAIIRVRHISDASYDTFKFLFSSN